MYVLISVILPPLFFAIFLLLLVKHLKRVIPWEASGQVYREQIVDWQE